MAHTQILGTEWLKNIDAFTYLGSRIISDGRSKSEILSRINQPESPCNR